MKFVNSIDYEAFNIKKYSDAIVMLTRSNSLTDSSHDLRDLAVSFAKILPVIFVLPNLEAEAYQIEKVDVNNLVILHIYNHYNEAQTELLNRALVELKCIRPTFWINNCYFYKFIKNRYSFLNIYHFSEDFCASESIYQFNEKSLTYSYIQILSCCDIVIFHSNEIKDRVEAFYDFSSKSRIQIFSEQDYDIQSTVIMNVIQEVIKIRSNFDNKLNVAILFDQSSVHVNTINEHLKSFGLFSSNNITFIAATQNLECQFDLNTFDVIVIHYSVRVSVCEGNFTLSPQFSEEIRNFGGYKILFIQDEYEGTEIARAWIERLGIHQVYTCVPSKFIEQIYPSKTFSLIEYTHALTGYVPIDENNVRFKYKKTSERPIFIGYRGRTLPYWYGSLGQEKLNIGVEVKKYCLSKNISVDIEWADDKRIYGENWYDFLINCRATLGTESGANIFDFDGSIRAQIEKKLEINPNLRYEDVHDELIAPREIISMNQISPKIFECILFKTALILFEGTYSGVIVPNVHYIPLRKDYSNLAEVIIKIQDNDYIDKLTQKAYEDIIIAGHYSYNQFVNNFDLSLKERVHRISSNLYKNNVFSHIKPLKPLESKLDKTILNQNELKYILRKVIPQPVKRIIKKILRTMEGA